MQCVDVNNSNLSLLPVDTASDGVCTAADKMAHPNRGGVEASPKGIQGARCSLPSKHSVESARVEQISQLVEGLESLTVNCKRRVSLRLTACSILKFALNSMDHERQLCSRIVSFAEAEAEHAFSGKLAERP